MPYRLELLGEPRIQASDGAAVDFPRGKPLALLCYLAVEKRPVDRSELGELLWPEAPQKRTRHSVRQAIWLIRRTLGEEVLEGEDPVAVSGMAMSCDLIEFEGALQAGKLDHARSLWRGPLLSRMSLSGCRGWDRWLEDIRSRLQRDLFQSLISAVRSDGGMSPGEKTLAYLDEALKLNPFSVEAHTLRVETFLEMGQVSRASRALDEARREVGDGSRITEELDLLGQKINYRDASGDDSNPERLGESLEFVGRAGELADLRGAWKRARTGYSGAACVLGPTGIGKTRLASEFLASVERDGGLVARARGFRGEHRIPWGSVSDLIQELILLPGAKGISSGSDTVLRYVIPSLSTNGNDARNPGGTGEVHPAALSDAVADLIEAVGFESPLAVFLDDWQWVDKESRALLAKVIRRVRGLPCFFLLAERTGERRLRQEGAASLIADLGGRKIALSPLDLSELGELVALLAEFEDPHETQGVVDQLHRVTGGNPLFVGEVLRKLSEDGIYQMEEGRWVLKAGKLSGELDLPESVQALIRERLERLSPAATQVASALARERRSVSAPALRRRAGLEEAVFARAMNELVDREVVSWVGPTDVDFSHDQLREAAGLSLRPPTTRGPKAWMQNHPGQFLLGALLVVVVSLSAGIQASRLWRGTVETEGSNPAPTYPFGHGRVILNGDSLVELVAPAFEGEAWTIQPSEIWRPSVSPLRARGPFRTPAGGIRWFGNETQLEEAPRTIEFYPDGSSSVFFESSGDDGFHDLAPSGDVALLMSENTESPTYRQNLIRVDGRDKQPTVIYHTDEMHYGSDWSPDGQKVAVLVSGAPDTVLVLTPTGSELSRTPVSDYRAVHQPVWCHDSRHLVMAVSGFQPGLGLLIDTQTGVIREFGNELEAIAWPQCLGNARGAIFQGLSKTNRGMFVQDFQTDALIPLFVTDPGERWVISWLPEVVEPPIWGIRINSEDRTLQWGSTHPLDAMGFRTDGSPAEVDIEWYSSDPGIASVSSAGVVTGNRVGEATIRAIHSEWVEDSVNITVREASESPGELLFRGIFDDTDLPDWIIPDSVTFPIPEVVERDGEKVLSLRGDGRYRDQILTNRSFPLQHGATLEFEFRLPLRRRDRERIIVCLRETLPEFGVETSTESFRQGEYCVLYPSAELSKREDDLIHVTAGDRFFSFEASGSPDLPSDSWVHLALQLRPDGNFRVFVNRREIFSYQNPFGSYSDSQWQIELAGASVGTELLVRDLYLWRGERFGTGVPGETGTTEPTPQSRR